ncbi:hypothetical protein GQ55_7G304000 [Panicum hallii var. hallii]|uniref:Uncharacterized protein n=1 Tax=Panicum hallii var. hallii TaxID=1504633 RepID=A0A2T7D0P7_9POAL|nr:hypothetical protein GQ55_7G304000 [Panicum hallii var. hallii]
MVSLILVPASPASAFTGGQLTLFGLVGAGGAPPHHGKMEIPAGFMGSKGARLAVVVGAAAGVELPGFGLLGAGGAAPRHGKTAFPAGFVASKGGRLAVVAAAAPGESDGGLPSGDCEAAVSAFRLQMELFKLKQRPLAFVGSPKDPLLATASGIAKDCELMGRADEGYMKADALANVIEGVKLVTKTFFQGVDLPEYSAPMAPLSAADVDKYSFFKELVVMSGVFYIALYWAARKKYSFGLGGAN